MLFSSVPFLIGFLPAVIVLTWLAERYASTRVTLALLVLASLFFYAWWNPPFLILLLVSVAANYGFGIALSQSRTRSLLAAAIIFNLSLIAYFKYANFFVDILNAGLTTPLEVGTVTLPLAISFFTFQQIAYQVDVYNGKIRDTDFIHYCLFVTFFPQLIAGPIVHHQEIIPQFIERKRFNLSADNFIVGSLIFAIGLYKKVIIADGIAPYADQVFSTALQGPNTFEAWGGAFAYSLQIYFDFSGYSDMAIGLARIFGIRLPVNFASPYKATNIIDFWKTWHITLSRFLRDYLYIPLGGNRRGDFRRHANLLITMLLGGLWHGANWTFVFWGALHGFFLIINHAWRGFWNSRGNGTRESTPAGRWVSRIFTYLCIVVAWVFFRADSWESAYAMIEGMVGLNGLGALNGSWQLLDPDLYLWLAVLMPIVWLAPNTQELMVEHDPAIGLHRSDNHEKNVLWRTRKSWFRLFACTCAITAILVIALRKVGSEDFIYMVF